MTPNFVVIGAQRCGTTALYLALKQHPQIFMSPLKEPRFFAFADQPADFIGPGAKAFQREIVSSWLDYQALFAGAPDQCCGEASPVYLSSLRSASSAAVMAQRTPELRIIALLRQPADRAYSAFWHHRRLGIEPLTDFRRALAAEVERSAAGWLPGFGYRANGMYAANLHPFLDHFPRSHIRIYLYETWRRNPVTVLHDMLEFLEVGVDLLPVVAPGINRSIAPRSHLLAGWLEQPNHVIYWGTRLFPGSIRGILGRWARRWNAKTPPPMAVDVRAELTASFRDDILQLQDMIDCDLSHWLVGCAEGKNVAT